MPQPPFTTAPQMPFRPPVVGDAFFGASAPHHAAHVAVQPLAAQAAGGRPQGQAGPLELLLTYLPMVMIVAVAWLLLYRPEQERMKRQREMLGSLKKNDRVVTTSGIYGTVANVDREADRVSLKVDDSGNVKISVTLSSIAKVLGDSPEAVAQNS
jgi:preprotein translocase subunit YajC